MAELPQAGPSPAVDLREPFTSDIILEVRIGKMKPLPGSAVESGIDKALCHGPVRVTKTGLEGDEHDPTFHGGVDKAVHGCKLSCLDEPRLQRPHSVFPYHSISFHFSSYLHSC